MEPRAGAEKRGRREEGAQLVGQREAWVILRHLGLSTPTLSQPHTPLSWPCPWKAPDLPGPRFPLLESSRQRVLWTESVGCG